MDLVGGRPNTKKCGACDRQIPETELRNSHYFSYKFRSNKLCDICYTNINDLVRHFSKKIEGMPYISDKVKGKVCRNYSKMIRKIEYDEIFFKNVEFTQ